MVDVETIRAIRSGSAVFSFLDIAAATRLAGRMPRPPRLDAPGVLHHVIARGIERRSISRDDLDREDFVPRLAARCRDGELAVLAWALKKSPGLRDGATRLLRPNGKPSASSSRTGNRPLAPGAASESN